MKCQRCKKEAEKLYPYDELVLEEIFYVCKDCLDRGTRILIKPNKNERINNKP